MSLYIHKETSLDLFRKNPQDSPTICPRDVWKDKWEIMQNVPQPDSLAGGHHPMGWIPGELDPDKYSNRPHWDGHGKHVGILALHPLSFHEPAKIRFTGQVDPEKPILCVNASGNVAGDGDFLLQCFVNDEKVGEYVVDSSQWHLCEFDISKQIRGATNPVVEIWNAGGGKNPWSFEHCYIDKIEFKAKAANLTGDQQSTASEEKPAPEWHR